MFLPPQIIHNTARKDRYNNIIAQCTEQGIDKFDICPAMMLENPITGCAYSHKKIIRMALFRNLPEVVIWEDDIQFTHKNAWQYFIETYISVKNKCDLFLGGSYFLKDVTPINNRVSKIGRFSGSHCCIVKHSLYKHILACPPNTPIDTWISKVHGTHNFLLCNPMPALQLPGYSDICGKEVDHSPRIPQEMVYRG